jgi:hypothetical protein
MKAVGLHLEDYLMGAGLIISPIIGTIVRTFFQYVFTRFAILTGKDRKTKMQKLVQ